MKKRRNKTGVTLVEILVVVAVITILIAMIIGIVSRIDTQGKEQLTKRTIALLNTSLGQFGDYGYTYSDPSYANFKFPLDCNGFSDTDIETELEKALGRNPGEVTISGGTHDNGYSGCEAMYFFLHRVPASRKALKKIDEKMITDLGLYGNPMEITVAGQKYPLYRIIDSWKNPLRYSYYDNGREGTTGEPPPSSPLTFPLITSAGPDGDFDTVTDNITNK